MGRVVCGNLDTQRDRLSRREQKASLADELARDESFKNRSDAVLESERKKREHPRKHKKHIH